MIILETILCSTVDTFGKNGYKLPCSKLSCWRVYDSHFKLSLQISTMSRFSNNAQDKLLKKVWKNIVAHLKKLDINEENCGYIACSGSIPSVLYPVLRLLVLLLTYCLSKSM